MRESQSIWSSRLFPVVAFVAMAHTVDIASTVYAAPDLFGEWNIMHRHFQLGIPGLLAVKAIWAILAVIGYDFYLRHRTACYPNAFERHLDFYRYFAFGPPIARRASDRIIARLRVGVHLGFLLVGLHALPFWAAFDNLLYGAGYAPILKDLSDHGYYFLQAFLVAALTLARFYVTNHQRYYLLRAADALPDRPQLQ